MLFGWKIVRRRRRSVSNSARSYQNNKKEARTCITERVRYFAEQHGFEHGRIAIRNSRRSWGSCSSLRNLNFNYKLLFLPNCLRDYIIVHELCHLRELNHSDRFWAHVVAIMPDALERARTLRAFERTRGTSLPALETLRGMHTESTCCKLEDDRAAVFVPPQRERGERTMR